MSTATSQIREKLVEIQQLYLNDEVRKARAGIWGMLETMRVWAPPVAGERPWDVVALAAFSNHLVDLYSVIKTGPTFAAEMMFTHMLGLLNE